MKKRIVVDANVFVKALFKDHIYAQHVLQAIQDDEVILLVSQPIRREILDVTYCVAIDRGASHDEALAFKVIAERILNRGRTLYAPKVFAGCPDRSDNKYFDCAIAGTADCIISEDSDLNGIVDPPIPVLSPWQFLNSWK